VRNSAKVRDCAAHAATRNRQSNSKVGWSAPHEGSGWSGANP
jgi:hypothetical protein